MLIFIRISRVLNQIAGMLAMLLIVYMFCHIILEIGLRMFGMSTYVLDEFIGYAVATMTFLGLGYSLDRGGLIRVNVLLDRLPERYHWLPDLVASWAACWLFSWLSIYWFHTVERSFIRGTTSQSLAATPLWIPQGAVLVGLALLCLTLAVRGLSLFVYRRPPMALQHQVN
ncbi:TRAP transporter small permease subunit [Celerinatantimonas sp. YJH-8]|uniref:TRAP transporter small permease subunit n=1 Tax=Celerinatantimonas sp. YJH-8 TaxID=3228714 RepID=UPI0038CB30B0